MLNNCVWREKPENEVHSYHKCYLPNLSSNLYTCLHVYTCTHVLMRDERRKEERSKQGQTNNKATQHSTPKAVTFPNKNELGHVTKSCKYGVFTITMFCDPYMKN